VRLEDISWMLLKASSAAWTWGKTKSGVKRK